MTTQWLSPCGHSNPYKYKPKFQQAANMSKSWEIICHVYLDSDARFSGRAKMTYLDYYHFYAYRASLRFSRNVMKKIALIRNRTRDLQMVQSDLINTHDF